MMACSSERPLAPCRHNRRATYPEWRRDRPVEATTTYRPPAGKVPIPGRFSCAIRDPRTLPAGRVFSFPVLVTHVHRPETMTIPTEPTTHGLPRSRFAGRIAERPLL